MGRPVRPRLADPRPSRFLRVMAFGWVLVLALSSCSAFRPEKVRVATQVTETLPPEIIGTRGAEPVPTGSAGPRTIFVPGRKGSAGSKGCANLTGVPGVRDGTIVLGTIQPMDGPAAQVGKPLHRTTQAYVNWVNSRGGINGCKLELHLQTACLNCVAENRLAAKALVEQKGAFAIVNTYMNTYAFSAAQDYLNQVGVPLIEGWSGIGDLEESWGAAQTPWNVYYTIRNDTAVEIYVRWLRRVIDEWNAARKLPEPSNPYWVATVGLDVVQDNKRADEFKRLWERQGPGFKVVTQQRVKAEEETVTRMDSFISAMRDADANAVFSASNITMLFGMQAAQRQSWKVPWLAKSAWGRALTDNCGSACDGGYTDNNGWGWGGQRTPQMADYMKVMRRYYPDGARYADAQTLGGWIGMMAFEYAATTLGDGLNRRALMDVLGNLTDFDTGVGARINTSPSDHLGMREVMMLQVCDNDFHQVTPWFGATGPMKRVGSNRCGWGW